MLPRTTILLTIALLAGCQEDERVVQVAREAADRQAEQNRQIARQNQEIAQTTNRLVEADGLGRGLRTETDASTTFTFDIRPWKHAPKPRHGTRI